MTLKPEFDYYLWFRTLGNSDTVSISVIAQLH